jgi:hypothetical protein
MTLVITAPLGVNMSTFTRALLFLPLVMAPLSGARQGVEPVRLFIEAEDFKPVEGDWQVKDFGTNYYANTFAICFLSRQRYLGAPEQGVASVAEKTIDVPRDGTFELWARYEQPYNYAVEFDVEILQAGKVVFQRGYGRLDAPKLWPFKEGLKPQVLWQWGPTDNIVWEGRDSKLELKQGQATLRLKKGPQKATQAARRNVDVFVLTDDKEGIERQLKEARYLPLDGWLTQAGDIHLTGINPANAGLPIQIQVGPCTEHSPYWVHVRDWPKRLFIGKKVSEQPLKADELLKPGEPSPAVEVGRFFDALNQFQWKVTVLGADGKPLANRQIELAFRYQVDPLRNGVFTTDAAGAITFFLDGDLRRTKRIRTVVEDLEQLAKAMKAFPALGKRPEKLPIWGIMEASSLLHDKGRVGELCREIALSLGSNTLPEVKSPQHNALIDVRGVATQDLAAHCKKLKAEGKADRIKVVSLGDEIHIGGHAKSPDDDPAFRDFLKRKSYDPKELALATLDEAKLELKDQKSLLYYSSHIFAFEKALDEYKQRTDILESELGKHVSVGANYSPHPYYWPKEGQWVRAFKRRAMTLPWGEDYTWQIPEASQQINGYLLAAFRAGARHHDLPIHWYAMPHAPGNTPANFRRAWWSALGHGAKQMNLFCATPLSVGYTENYVVSEAVDTWKEIHRVVHETGQVEDALLPAKVRVGEVGIVISFAQDLWETDPAYNHERKSLYLALRHGGFSVDFITEEDIQEDKIKHLKCIYLVGDHLEKATARKLAKWVFDGGVLAGIGGGGFRDEHNRPTQLLGEMYGVKEQQLEKHHKIIMSKEELPRLKPIDEITWTEQFVKKTKFPALGVKQTFKPAERSEVMAKYADGSPAVLRKSFGNGFTYLFGSFISSAYIRTAIPIRPNDRSPLPTGFSHYLPTDFDGELGDLVTSPCGMAEVRYEYITNEPLVETMILEGPDAVVVVLVNWTPEPKKVKLTVQQLRRELTKATSVTHGALGIRRIHLTGSFDVQVDVADVVVIHK